MIDDRRPMGESRRIALATAAGFALIAALVWGPTLRCGFLWDDEYYIVSNTALRSWSYAPRYFTDVATTAGQGRAAEFAVFRPLRNLSYLLDFQLAGLNPAWWHLVNVLLHVLNALLLAGIGRRLIGGRWGPALAGLVFLVHPAQSEAVAWLKCRDDLLSVMFVLLAFDLWLRWRPAGWNLPRVAALGGLYLAACLAKEQAIVLPLLMLACARWAGVPPDRAPSGRDSRGLAVGLAAVAAGFLLWRHWFIGHTAQCGYPAGAFLPTMLTMTRAGLRYVQLLVYPRTLLADYSGMEPSSSLADGRVWACGGALFALAAAAVALRRRWPRASYGAVWIAIALLPVSNVVATMQYLAERFLYLPLAGFALAIGAAGHALARRRPWLVYALGGLLIAAYGVRSAVRVPDWRSNLTLFEATVRDTPATALRPRRDLLVARINAGRFAQALDLGKDLWERTQDDPHATPRERAEAARHYGFALLQTGEVETGASLIRRAVELDSTYFQPYLDAGMLEGQAGEHAEALEWFTRAAARAPLEPATHYNRGIALRELGQAAEAEAAFRRAVAVGGSEDAYQSLAALLWSQGRMPEAAAAYRDGLRVFPRNAELRAWRDRAEAAATGRR
jgi:tetratricopeptide (TPR) repeat protein